MTKDTSILFIGVGGCLVALEPDSGREIWRHQVTVAGDLNLKNSVLWCFHGDVVYAASCDSVVALDRTTGNRLWVQRMRSSWLVTLHLESGHLYVGAGGELYCLNPSSGEILWHNKLKGLGRGVLTFDSTPAMTVAAVAAIASQIPYIPG